MTAHRYITDKPNRLKTLLIVRHAHRNKDKGREADNGLSPKGRLQAKCVRLFFKRVHPDQDLSVYSSPKRRCLETVEGIAKRYSTQTEILRTLDEQSESENGMAFRKRIDHFFRWWQDEAPEFCVICSHGDWIPLFFQKATGSKGEIGKGGIIELGLEKSREVSVLWFLSRIGCLSERKGVEGTRLFF